MQNNTKSAKFRRNKDFHYLQFKRRRCNEPVYIFKVPLNYSALQHDDVPSIWFCFDLYQLSIKSEQTVDWRYHFEKNKTLTL